jgi:hypothetical protein
MTWDRFAQAVGVEEVPAAGFSCRCSLDPTSAFLIKTLRCKRTLHDRNGVTFATLKSWRSPIKEFQVAALTALKRNPPCALVDEVGAEMVRSASQIYGHRAFSCVVPVPGGNSGMRDSLSVRLGANIADGLGCEFAPVLGFEAVGGASTPKKSAKLKPFWLTREVHGSVLLVDDVASSGRHLELAYEALTRGGARVVAMAWIGP